MGIHFILSFIIGCGFHLSSGQHIGCFMEEVGDEVLTHIASDYDPTQLTAELCVTRCTQDYRIYAMVMAGIVCVCGDSISHLTSSNVTDCDVTCPGGDVRTCGGHGYGDVYKSPQLIFGLKFKIPAIIAAFNHENVNVTSSWGNISSYQFRLDDVTVDVMTSEAFVDHVFYETRAHLLGVTATDVVGGSTNTTALGNVETPINGLRLLCPEANIVGEAFRCNVTLEMGSNVEVKVNVRDGTIFYLNPPDTLLTTYGSVHPGDLPPAGSLPSGDDASFLLLEQMMTSPGRLQAVDILAERTGQVTLEIYRPTCPNDDEFFCFLSLNCTRNITQCSPAESRDVWAVTCPMPDSVYVFDVQACINITSGEVLRKDAVFDVFQWISPVSWNLTKTADLKVDIGKPGLVQHLLTDGSAVDVLPGDVFRLLDAASIVSHTVAPSSEANHVELLASDQRLMQTPVDLTAFTAVNAHHMIRLQVVTPSEIQLTHKYATGLSEYNITSTATSPLTPVGGIGDSSWFVMDVQAAIDNVTLNVLRAAPTNSTLRIMIEPHSGSKVTYLWDMGDGTVLNTTEKEIEYVYTEPGIYMVHLIAENSVSLKETMVAIIIEDPLENLEVFPLAGATIFNREAFVIWTVTQGTNLTYNITFGDDQQELLSKGNIPSGFNANISDSGGKIGYMYQTPGNFSFTINASNLVSSAEMTLYLPVQKVIQNFRIIDKAPVPWHESYDLQFVMGDGSHLSFNSTLNDTSIMNITIDDPTLEGVAYIDHQDYSDIGLYVFSITVWNLVTKPQTAMTEVWIEYLLTNATLVADEMFIIPGTKVNFILEMLFGSRYEVISDYGDSRPDETRFVEKTTKGELVHFNHIFTEVKNSTVTFDVSNHVSSITLQLVITIQNPVRNFQMTATTPLSLNNDGMGGMIPVDVISRLLFMDEAETVEPPTDASYIYDFADGIFSVFWNFLVLPNSSVIEALYTYTKVGTYNVTVNVSNLASSQTLYQLVEVDQPINGDSLKIYQSQRNVNVSQDVWVWVTVNWGSRIQVKWEWGDGKVNTSYVNDFTQPINMSHAYVNNMNPTVKVTVFNSIASYTINTSLVIQHPIIPEAIIITCDTYIVLYKRDNWTKEWNCNVDVTEKPYPTDAEYSVDFDDGKHPIDHKPFAPAHKRKKRSTSSITKPYLTFSHNYTKGADYLVNITIENLVSVDNVRKKITVMEDLDELEIRIEGIINGTNQTYDSRAKLPSEPNYFAMEDTIHMKVLQHHGTHTVYIWDMGDETGNHTTHLHHFHYDYAEPGHFTLTLVVINSVNTKSVSHEMHIQRSIYDTAISCPTPLPVNYTFVFSVDFGSIGSEVCYKINFVETTPEFAADYEMTTVQLYGNESMCGEAYANYAKDGEFIRSISAEEIELNRTKRIDNGNLTIDYTYWETGVNIINFCAWNIVTKQVCIDWRMVVTRGVCYDPVMNLTEANPCLESLCNNETFPGRRVPQNLKSNILAIRSNVRPNCTSTQNMLYQWTVHRVNMSNFENADQLGENELDGAIMTSRELRIKYRVLDYGFYRFTLNASMEGEIGIECVDSVVVEVKKSDLKGNILGGRDVRYKWKSNITIDAITQTEDPDVGPKNHTGMVWHWYCKKVCEHWPTFSDNYTEIIKDAKDNNTCRVPDKGDDDGGCDYQDGYKSPEGYFANTTSGKITISSIYMYENMTYEVMVIVWKDTRFLKLTQFITVIDGDPPSAALICVTNCDVRYNPNDRFSVRMIIDETAAVDYSFSWALIAEKENPKNSLAKRVIEELEGWDKFVTTLEHSENLALDPGYTFKDCNDPKVRFYFLLKVWRSRGSEDNYGTAAHSLVINTPPSPLGNCTSSPVNGTACTTVFGITCKKPCSGKMVPFSYDAFYKTQSNSNGTLLWSHTFFPDSLNLILPRGEEPDGAVELTIRCTDRVGSYSDTSLLIYTDHMPPPTPGPTQPGYGSNSVDGEMDVEAKNVENILRTDPASAPECGISAALGLPASQPMSTTTTTTTTPSMTTAGEDDVVTVDPAEVFRESFEAVQKAQIENAKVAEAKTPLALSLSDVVPTDLSQANIIAATVSVILDKPDQNNFETLQAALKTGDNIIALIKESIESQEATAGEIDEASKSCLCLYDPLLKTLTKKAKDCYDLSRIDPDLYGTLFTEIKEQLEECNNTIGQIESMINDCEAKMADLGDRIMKVKVNSESATQFSCGNVTMNADRRFSNGMNATRFRTGKNNFKFPNDLEGFFGTNNTAYAYEVQTKVVDENIYNFANDTLNVSTPIVFFNLKNNSDGDADVAEAEAELAITLTRAPNAAGTEKHTIADSEGPTYHQVNVTQDSALIIRVRTVINDTTEENDTLTTVAPTHPPTTAAVSADQVQSQFPENVTKEWKVYIREDKRPDIDNQLTGYEYNCSLPLSLGDLRELKLKAGLSEDNDDLPDRYTCFIPAEDLNRTYTAKFFVAIVKLVPPTPQKSGFRQKRDVPEDGLVAMPTEPPPTSGVLELRTTKCVWWDKSTSKWSTAGCREEIQTTPLVEDSGQSSPRWEQSSPLPSASVKITPSSVKIVPHLQHSAGPMTKTDSQQCLCKRTGTFAAEFVVPINLPDFSKPPFAGLESNPLVFCVMLSILCVYAVMLIWARRKDRDDEILAGACPLVDNNPRDRYLYELVLYTGNRTGAGTTANVRFVLVGDQAETKPRLLADTQRPCLKRGNVDVFVMAVPRCLGHLTHLRIWHDNSGADPSWFFSRLQVVDIQTQQQVFFMVNRWLAVEEDDGQIARIVPTAGSGELVGFQHLFFTKTRRNLSDSHLWFSVLQRPVRSRFTRVQRLTCCLVLLYTSMTSSIMFYGANDKPSNAKAIHLGPLTITTTQIVVGVLSSLIAIPFSVIVTTLFRYAEPKPPTQPKKPKKTKVKRKPAPPAARAVKGQDASRGLITPRPGTGESRMTAVESPEDIGLGFIDHGDAGKQKVLSVDPIPAASPTYKQQGMPKISTTAQPENKEKRKALPYWCVHLSYFLSFLVCCVAFYFTVGVSLVFGQDRSEDWLVSFVIGFFESVFLSQPLKVFVLAMLYALIIRKPDTEEEMDSSNVALAQNETWLHDGKTPECGQEHFEPLDASTGAQPLDPEMVKAAREKRMKEMEMSSITRDIMTYIIFLIILMTVAYTNKDPHTFHMHFDHKSALMNGDYGNGSFALKKVNTREKLWQFAHEVLLPTLYVTRVYGNLSAPWGKEGFFADYQNYIMGQPRLRLLRTRPEACPERLHIFETVCRPAYSMFNQDEQVYKKGWQTVNASDPGDVNDTMWSYRTSSELDGYPYIGLHATYSGGGYVANLGLKQDSAKTAIKELIDHGWLDRYTRVVFLEFLVYNANTNLFGACMIAIEFLQTGGIHPTFKFYILRLNPYVGVQAYINVTIELLLLFFILYFVVREAKKIKRKRKAYFDSLANCFEVLVLALSIGMIVMFFYRLFISLRMSELVSAKPNMYHNFDYVIVWHEAFAYLLDLVTGLSTIKFINILRFNKKMLMLSQTLSYALKPMARFMMAFMLAFLAFVLLGHLAFGRVLYEYSTFVTTLQTLFAAMLNKFNYGSLEEANRYLGPAMLFSFTLVISIVLLNMFISVVIEAFTTVKYDISRQANDYELVEFILDRLKGMLGMEDRRKLQEAMSDASVRMNTRYKEGGPVEDLHLRIERLLQIVDTYMWTNSDRIELSDQLIELEQLEKAKMTRTLYVSA